MVEFLPVLEASREPNHQETSVPIVADVLEANNAFLEAPIRRICSRSAAWRKKIEAGALKEAHDEISRYLIDAPRDPEALEQLGIVLAKQRRFEEAAEKFRAAIELDPKPADFWRNLARAYLDLGRHADAEPCFQKVIDLEPELPANRRALAEFYRRRGKYDAAIALLERAMELDPSCAAFPHEKGRVLAEMKRYGEAKASYLLALEKDPDSSECLNDLGVACQELGEHDEAIRYLREAIRLRPGVVGVYNNLGVALNEQRRFEEAIECFNRGLAVGPDYALAWNNLGNSLRAVGRNRAAVAALETAIRLKPDYPEAYNNLAIAYVQMGENEKALAWYDKALLFRPDYPECHMNRALQRLMIGDLSNGWADYEWRWQLKTMRHRDLKKPLWDGSPLGGKRILIYWEQGLGDSIQFIRYAKELKDRGATVIFEGQPALQHIFSRTPGLDEFVVRGATLPPFDVHAPLLSLPGQCHTTLESVPSDVPYIFPDMHFVKLWAPRLESLKGLRVGIAWQGNPDHRGDHLRSFPLALFEALGKIDGITLVSLQRNFGAEQLERVKGEFDVVSFDGIDEEADGFLRTAAIMKNLDLVISADTSIAHLAAAMGAPTWIAIAVASDWRWLRRREDSPWYPTVRLFRQKEPGDWKDVFQRLAVALKERVAISPRRLAPIGASDRRKARELIRQASKSLAAEEPTKAAELLEQAVQVDPESVDAHHDLGVIHGRQRRISCAIACFRRALEIEPTSSSACGNLGLAFLQNRQFAEAVTHLRKAVHLGGGAPDVYNNLGMALSALPDAPAAEAAFVRALHLRPTFVAAHCNLARALLMQGKFEQGWLESEWRLKLPSRGRELSQPRWTGEPMGGRTIHVWTEPGASVGELVQFLRYAITLRQREARVVLECPAKLVKLFSACDAIDDVIAAGDIVPKFDVHAALLSLPAILGTTLNSVPAPIPYLRAEPDRIERWRPTIKEFAGLNVGFAWKTEERPVRWDGDPTLPLDGFRRLGRCAGVRLVSLQEGIGGAQLSILSKGTTILNLGAEFDSSESTALLDVAAIMMSLDLVITGDGAIAHLAGAMGVAVWLALPSSANSRWLLERNDSPWYPGMRIFRQRQEGDWAPVFDEMARALFDQVAKFSLSDRPGLSAEARARTMYDEGCRHFARGELAPACGRFQQALEVQPDWAAVHHDLAVALAKQRKLDPAIRHFRRCLELDPSSKAYGNLGSALLEKGDHPAAIEEVQRILKEAPELGDLHWRLGAALARLKKLDESLAPLEKAVELLPQSADARYWFGDVLRRLKRPADAIQNLRQAARIRPNWREAHNALGLCLAELEEHAPAVESFRETVRIAPDSVEAWNNLAISLVDLNQLPEAAQAFQHALYVKPDNAETHRNLAMTLLLQGNYEQGWLEYEWRLRSRGATRRKLPGRRWDGTPLTGKRLLISAEQGVGETIQFVRYARLAREMGAKTIVECQPPLLSLLARCPYIDRVIAIGEPAGDVDFHSAMMSLPVGFKTTLENVPSACPYLFADPELQRQCAAEIRGDSRIRIGILWQGNRGSGGDRQRSIPLSAFQPLAQLESVELISLQKGEAASQVDSVGFAVRKLDRLEQSQTTFDDMAAIVANLDAIVACDSSLAHLAGAMGIPVLLALSTANDWRWLRERPDSPWYPSAHLFRQSRRGEWGCVFAEIAELVRARFISPPQPHRACHAS